MNEKIPRKTGVKIFLLGFLGAVVACALAFGVDTRLLFYIDTLYYAFGGLPNKDNSF